MQYDKKLCIGLSLNNRLQNNTGNYAYDTIEDQLHIAKQAEIAKLDFVFKPDSLYMLPTIASQAKGTSGIDPTLTLSLIARETNNIGLVTTMSTAAIPPYIIARQIQSLNWVSNGRAGWNIVTSIDGGDNFGQVERLTSEERYRKAKESTEIVRKLWNSYPNDAVNIDVDRLNDVVRPINFRGEFFKVKGPLNIAAHHTGDPVLFQAGASDSGRDFAASVAEGTFAATPTMDVAITLRKSLRQKAKEKGRSEEDIRVLPGMYFFISDTYDKAARMYQDAHKHITLEQKLRQVESILGLDLHTTDIHMKITSDMLPNQNFLVRSRTHADLLRHYIVQNEPSLKELLQRPEVIHSAHWVVIGTPEQVVDEIEEWFVHEAMDGFIALPGGTNMSLAMFFEEVIPLLVKKGLFRKEYSGSTLRVHLNG